jgi:uncharacterized protein YdeI (YjbR/CyaY-like superfamily)
LTEKEILVGFHKVGSGKPSISWSESVDVALCFGWIDGIRKSIDEFRYTIRFTPRKPQSNWSTINIRKIVELSKLGLMLEAGLAAFKQRKDQRSGIYAYERGYLPLSKAFEKKLRKSAKAWKFFKSLPASIQKHSMHWVMSARQEATRERRLNTLIKDSEAGRKIKPFSY